MNIYSKKQRWKMLLFILAVAIVGASLWYTSVLVKKIAREERKKVELWAEAIRKKAKLVNYTNELFKKISAEERKKVELWVEATKLLASAEMTDWTFISKVVEDNTTVPVILSDEDGNIISHRNLDPELSKDNSYLRNQMQIMAARHDPIEIRIYGDKKNYLFYKDSKLFSELRRVMDDLIRSFISEIVINSASVPVIYTTHSKDDVIAFGNIDTSITENPILLSQTIAEMESENPPITIDLGKQKASYIFYQDSFLLTQLKYYPVIQFAIIGLFILIAYWLFSMSRRAEQNQVWVGMAKETAHQLGTPLSSLMAWLELLKSKNIEASVIDELDKDIQRLETITERFSKIGSRPELKNENVITVLENSIHYVRSRSSEKIKFEITASEGKDIYANFNIPLFEWVIENMCKNAIDAMNGNGKITIEVSQSGNSVFIDVADTGKGIPSSKHKTIFEPGYTTKKRGWGLGLSLTKRIVENYHSGKVFVKRSEPKKGTTIRIVLSK